MPNNADIELSRQERAVMSINLWRHLNFFPHFPNIELINDLSRESYERKICVADFVFLPFKSDVAPSLISFSYADENICFDNSNRRLIRKISESLDEQHALVLEFVPNNDSYYIKGIVDKSSVDGLFKDYYFISIIGYMNWSARCKNFNLFDYSEEEFYEFNHSSSNIKKQIDNVIALSNKLFLNICNKSLSEILDIIIAQKHGACFVIFGSNKDAMKAADKLCEAGRGFKAKDILPYSRLQECISQFTKVDGGLILDKELNCYAYGCIYDGSVEKSFSGSLARGSRFNSTKLYVHSCNKKNMSCLGVVFSDDGGVECVK